jgi:hypothetical protein
MKILDLAAGNYLKARNQAENQDLKLSTVKLIVPALLAFLLVGGPARAVDPECAHMLTAPANQDGIVYDVQDGLVRLCTPALTRLGNPMPEGTVLDSCVVEFGEGSSYTVAGPHDMAVVVQTVIPVALEFDHPMNVRCDSGGKEGAVLVAVASFPFSGPGVPGKPLPSE